MSYSIIHIIQKENIHFHKTTLRVLVVFSSDQIIWKKSRRMRHLWGSYCITAARAVLYSRNGSRFYTFPTPAKYVVLSHGADP
jgi:hypothetical protein